MNQLFKEKTMGFLQDTKAPESPPQPKKEETRGLVVLIIIAVGTFLGWVFKPIFIYLGTFEGRSPIQVRIQIGILLSIATGIIIGAYQISFVRQLTISRTHTFNHSQYGGRIVFPEGYYFAPEGSRRKIPFASRTYVTFAGYTKGRREEMYPNECQMVTNWNQVELSSVDPPRAVEGFADEVSYSVIQSVQSLTGFDYVWERLTRPQYWLREDKLAEVMVERAKKENWKRFIDDWDLLPMYPGGQRAFKTRSLWNEHAIICF